MRTGWSKNLRTERKESRMVWELREGEQNGQEAEGRREGRAES
jgi:hypothetical protein